LNLLTPDGATLYANRAALDGKGIDAKIFNAGMRAGHHGMPGMHERAKLAGGKLTFWSQPGLGNEIELTIPAPLAYVKDSPAAQTAAPVRATAMIRQHQSFYERKAAMEKQKGNATSSSVLKWEVFVTPGIPIGTPDRPAGITETLFQAMASTLIYGERDAVLVDTFMTVKQATELADWVESKGKNLTTIYITHGHGDHWFGAGTILKRFPKARLVATPSSIKVMAVNSSPQVLDGAWKLGFPG